MDQAGTYCEELVREADKDRFLATLFAPADRRPALFALYSFATEVARVRDLVSEPLPGEVRLQWWREVVEGERAGEAAAHPIARSLIEGITMWRLPRRPLADLVEARIFDLYDDPMPTLTDLEGYAGETNSALFQLAAIVLAGGQDPGTAELSGHAGVAHTLTAVLRAFPLHASRGQLYVPGEVLERHGVRRADVFSGRTTPELMAALAEMRAHVRRHLARAEAASMPPATIPAFLPLSVIEGYLRHMERPDYDPFTSIVQVAQWRRQWVMWWAARRYGRRPAGSGPAEAVAPSIAPGRPAE
jgi:phytoene synthase